MTDYLLVDISNSYTKLAFASATRISNPMRIATSKLSSSVVARFLRKREVRKVVVSSVVPAKNPAISKAARKVDVLWLDSTQKLVDFGTAVTFDIVSDRRTYIGGVIAPGLEAMTNFLYQRTALLPQLSLKEPRRAIGKSTIEAMLSGAVFGYRGLVREIVARIRAEQFPRKKIYTVATGGYAQLIAARLPEISAVRPHLTLEGLRIVANLN